MHHWFTRNGEHKIYLRRAVLNPHAPEFDFNRPTHGYSLSDLKNVERQFSDLWRDLLDFQKTLHEPVAQFKRLSARERRRVYSRVLKTLEGADSKDAGLRRSFGL
jgi:hypothetical protein